MSFNDKCAVAACWNHEQAAFLTYLSLYALQHRGQEGAGITSLHKGKHISHKDQGLVGSIFHKKALNKLQGLASIGHTRYSTTGSNDFQNLQPFNCDSLASSPISVAHNGNIVNHSILKQKYLKTKNPDESDTKCLFYLMSHFEKTETCLKDVLLKSFSLMEGAFSMAILTKDSLIAVRDSMGFRPLVLGKKDQAYIVVSETCALDLIGARYIRDIQAGEVLIINKKGMTSYFLPKKTKAQCIFEYVYFSRPDSLIFGQNVYERRQKMGEYLAQQDPVKADMVIPVPDSGVPAAIAYARYSGIPYEMGIIRNHYIGRTFIQPSSEIRNFIIKIKLNPQAHLIKGKKIILVDDSIVRGVTSKSIVELLRSAGAKEVHFRVSSPVIKSPCYYGVDTPQKSELISSRYNIEETRRFIGADSLAYLSYENLLKSNNKKKGFCTACFTEKYPTAIYET